MSASPEPPLFDLEQPGPFVGRDRERRLLLERLDAAIDGCRTGHFAAMVTAPLHKGVINDAGIPFSGHTEFLAELTDTPLPVMMLVAGELRVALADRRGAARRRPRRSPDHCFRCRCRVPRDAVATPRWYGNSPSVQRFGCSSLTASILIKYYSLRNRRPRPTAAKTSRSASRHKGSESMSSPSMSKIAAFIPAG